MLLCSPKLLNFLNGSGIAVNGLFKLASNIDLFGMLSGTFLSPSMSSENVNNLTGILDNLWKAFITIVVLQTSPKVPI